MFLGEIFLFKTNLIRGKGRVVRQKFLHVPCFPSLLVCMFALPVRRLRILNEHMFLGIMSRVKAGETIRISQKFVILKTNTETSVSKKTG